MRGRHFRDVNCTASLQAHHEKNTTNFNMDSHAIPGKLLNGRDRISILRKFKEHEARAQGVRCHSRSFLASLELLKSWHSGEVAGKKKGRAATKATPFSAESFACGRVASRHCQIWPIMENISR